MWGWAGFLLSCHHDRVADKRAIIFQIIIIEKNLSYDLDFRILAFEAHILEISVDMFK